MSRLSETTRRAAWISGGAGLLILVLAAGVLPRLGRRRRLAAVVAVNTETPLVTVGTVDTAPATSVVTLPATLAPIESAPIYARAPGYVGRNLVDIGARVRKGALLAQVDAPELDQQVEEARAAVAQARASLALAQVELDRWRTMATQSAVTADELDQKQAAFNLAAATVRSAEANERRLIQLQSYERVVAPFTGVITARNVNPGTLVGTAGAINSSLPSGASSAAGSLFQLDRIDTLRVYVTVPEDNAAAVQVGQSVVVTMPALTGDTLRGTVVRTSNALDPAARTLLAEVDVANPSGAYLPGAYAQVQLGLRRTGTALRVPATALVIRGGPPQVITVGADSTLAFTTVMIGRDYGSWVEVTGGLARGATVVENPPDGLVAGQRVQPRQTQLAPAGP